MGFGRIKLVFSSLKCKPTPISSTFQQSQCRCYSSVDIQSRLKNVGFIGLGNMGSRMAMNLLKSGFRVCVHDINEAALKQFLDKGVPVKETPKEIAEASDVVITMLPSSNHVMDAYMGPNGLLHSSSSLRPWLFIDSSTIDPLVSRNLSQSVSGCTLKNKLDSLEKPSMLDAPVSGGTLAAESGQLTFMVGGMQEAYEEAELLFLSMGRASIYCGGAGSGLGIIWTEEEQDILLLSNVLLVDNLDCSHLEEGAYTVDMEIGEMENVAKICNNLAMAISMIGVSEALAFGQSQGIAASTLTRIFNCSSARCWSRWKTYREGVSSSCSSPEAGSPVTGCSCDNYNPVPGVMDGVPSSRDYQGGFASKLMAKDLDLAVASASKAATKHPLTCQAQKIYHELCKDGNEAKDFSCVFRYYYGGKDESSG